MERFFVLTQLTETLQQFSSLGQAGGEDSRRPTCIDQQRGVTIHQSQRYLIPLERIIFNLHPT